MSNAAFTQIAGAPFRRQQWNGRFHAPFGGITTAPQELRQTHILLLGLFHGSEGGSQRVNHRLFAGLSLATRLDALQGSLQHMYDIGFIQFIFTRGRYTGAQERGSIERATRAANRRNQRSADRFENRANIHILLLSAIYR